MTKKMKKKKVILLTLIEDLKKLNEESLLEKKVKKDSYSLGYVHGELWALETMERFIDEAMQ